MRIAADRRDDIGALFESLNRMSDNLTAIIARVGSSSEAIAAASAQIATGSQHLSSHTEAQAGNIEETSASMEQLASTVRRNTQNARQTDQLALASSDVAQKGAAVVNRVVAAMNDINDNSRRIVEIIGIIDSIAFQTNILALNAAVEAARAGEQGRGFAVVATEVRHLAARSATAAKEIKDLIQGNALRITQGTELASQAGQTMQEIVQSVQHVTRIMNEILSATEEQEAGITQVNQAVSQMHATTQQDTTLIEAAAVAARDLHLQAEHLTNAVRIFQLSEGNAAAAPDLPPRIEYARS